MLNPISSQTPIGSGGEIPLFAPPKPVSSESPLDTFTGVFGKMVNETNAAQANADNAVNKLVTGEGGDIHEVMLAMEQARLSMLTLVEVRNRVVDAYQELSRMPI